MKTFAILFAGSCALALSACGGTDDSAADEGTDVTVVQESPAPIATETTVVEGTGATDSSTPDSVSVGPDGVKLDVDSNGTRVKADTNGDAVTVSKSD